MFRFIDSFFQLSALEPGRRVWWRRRVVRIAVPAVGVVLGEPGAKVAQFAGGELGDGLFDGFEV
jgi:hypothetical protein